jgi:ABC-2 type transport system ATP-binding protein
MRVQLLNVTLKYGGRAALHDVTALLDGRIVGVLGANASGKTSLLQVLAGMATPTEGRVLVDDDEVHPGRRPGISYLPQETGFFPFWQRPRETLSTALLLRGVKDYDPRELLAALGLEDEDRSASEFSGGMKQKLRIAQALVHAPRLLLLDEPTTGLDVRERFRILRMIERLRDRVSIIFSTHHPEDVAAVADMVLILHCGRAIATGTPGDLKALAENHVFEVSLISPTLPAESSYDVVRVDRDDSTMHLRVVGSCPSGGTSVTPRLEDAYVLLTRVTKIDD